MFLRPSPPPYDPLEWAAKPYPEKSRLVCTVWATQGTGSPLAVYIGYAVKVLLFVGGWLLFCGFTPGLGGLSDIGTWWLDPEAFRKAILWSLLFEGLGLGCGSGPLTGRYFPPLGGVLYFARPGTTKLPTFEGAPVVGGPRRTVLDAAAYVATVALVVAALVSAHPGRALTVAVAVALPVLGILDKTLFLCFRGEHYWTVVLVFALTVTGPEWIAGVKGIWAAVWFFAGVSKLNHHFPAVVGVMTSNSPLTRVAAIRRMMYRSYPDDLSPSRVATLMGHAGTALELTVPLVLLAGDGGTVTVVGLGMMLALHGFITGNVPMGVPIEWNVTMVYGAFFLFWKNAAVGLGSTTAPVAAAILVLSVGVPVLGNLAPDRVPFLLAMRYYAGNWAYSIWLFRGDSHRRLERLTKSSPWVYDQIERFYDHATAVQVVGRIMAFRLMHLHGRALAEILPRAVDHLEEYEWVDGEIVAGLVLGWNFGDGHLHSEQLLRNVQLQCGFEPGELVCIMVEAQPMLRQTLQYRVVDASRGRLLDGHADIRELRRRQPWAWIAGG